jgi:hypothetical protein
MKIPNFEDFNSSNCKPRSLEIHYPDFYKMIVENYHCDTWNENLYWYYNNLTDYPRCRTCGSKTKFINLKEGYREYCSKKCSNSDPSKKELTKQTCIVKYGGVAPACSKEVRNKMEETNLERFGVVNAMQNEEISSRSQQTREELYGGCGNASKKSQKLYKETMLKKYGVDNPMKSEDIQESFKNNLFEKYGVDSTWKIQSVQDKIVQTCLERYGKERYNNPEKIKHTMLSEYGAEGNFGRECVREKSLQTCIERYGDAHYNNQDKHKQTLMERYGVENIMQIPGVLDKHKNSLIERYGVENVMQIPGVLDKINQTKRLNNTFNTSQIEELFKIYLDSNNIEYEYQYKCDRYPFNCDFYIKEYDLFIEIQANWCHGKHPYDPEKDNEIVRIWKNKNTKYYNNAIETWTIRDVKKRNIAKENNLNYLEIFSNNIDEVIYEYTKAIDKFRLGSE